MRYVESFACSHIFDMMCHSGTYEHVMSTMLLKVENAFMDEYPDKDRAGLLKVMVQKRQQSIKRIEELSSSAKKEALRPRDAARRDWLSKLRCIELGIYEGWESFTLKQLAKSQVDVDLKRLTIPYKFNMLKFRAFFRAMEDDSSLSLVQKRHVLEFMHGGLIMCDIRKEKLLEKEFTTTWPTRKQLVKAGFLCIQGYEPVHMFLILGKHFTKELFAYMAPKIQAFMHDMRGSKCMFDIDYDALSSHVLHVPILPQQY